MDPRRGRKWQLFNKLRWIVFEVVPQVFAGFDKTFRLPVPNVVGRVAFDVGRLRFRLLCRT